MNDLKRLNVRVSSSVNEWLDIESAKTGVAKSSLVQMILSDYIREQECTQLTPELLDKLKELVEQEE